MYDNLTIETAVDIPWGGVGHLDLDTSGMAKDPLTDRYPVAWYRLVNISGGTLLPIAFDWRDVSPYMNYLGPMTGGPVFDADGRLEMRFDRYGFMPGEWKTTRHVAGTDYRDAPFHNEDPEIPVAPFGFTTWMQVTYMIADTHPSTTPLYLLVQPGDDLGARGGSTRFYFDTSNISSVDEEWRSYAGFYWFDQSYDPWPIEAGARSMSLNWYRRGIRGPGAARTFTPNYTGKFTMTYAHRYAAQIDLFDFEGIRAANNGTLEPGSATGPGLGGWPLTPTTITLDDGSAQTSWDVVKGTKYLLLLRAISGAQEVQHLLDGPGGWGGQPWISQESEALTMDITHTEIFAAPGSLGRPLVLSSLGVVEG